jgi:hypothetical protein
MHKHDKIDIKSMIGKTDIVTADRSSIRLEFAVKECIVTGNILESSPTVGRTCSLIREDGSGGTGVNIVKDNVLRQSGAGTIFWIH